MKVVRKFGAIVLAIMMIAMVTTSFATEDYYSGSNNTNAITGTGNRIGTDKIPLTKSIILFNADGHQVYEPTITFKYVVEPDTNVPAIDASSRSVDPEVTDNQSPAVVANVYKGPADGVDGVTIDFTPGTLRSASADGTELERTGELSLSLDKFSRPGIYRYKITEKVFANATTAAVGSPEVNVTTVGMTERETGTEANKYNSVRYLDVYIRTVRDSNGVVQYDSNNNPVLEMYGAVIFKTNVGTTNKIASDIVNINSSSTGKTTGFAPEKTDPTDTSYSYANDPTVDKYYTYNITVAKDVAGSLADANHEFPFAYTISNTINGAKYRVVDRGASEADGTVTSGASVLNVSGFKMKHGQSITYYGLPSNQVNTTPLNISVTETNDTWDKYTADAKYSDGDTTAVARNLKKNDNGTAAATQVLDRNDTANLETEQVLKNAMTDTVQKILFTNTLKEISPTGYVTRFAPYALILIGGIVLLIISKKHKKSTEED